MCKMDTILWMVIAGVLVNTMMAVEKKQVNIALETVLKFGKKDQTSGLDVIDKVQNALEKIKDNMQLRVSRRSNNDDMTFAGFVADAANILKQFNDNDLVDVFDVIGEESKRYINKEAKLHELFDTDNVRRHLNEKFDNFADIEANALRRNLNKVITAVENQKYMGEKNDLLDIGNYLYIGEDEKLRAALRNLEKLRTSNDVRSEAVLRHTLRSLIFDHFSHLNNNIKRELIDMAKDYWRAYGDKKRGKYTSPSRIKSAELTQFTRKGDRNRLKFNAQRYMSEERPILRDRKTNNVGHKNKRYNYKSKIQKDREAVTPFTKRNKFKEHTMKLFDSKEKIDSYADYRSEASLETIKHRKPRKVTRKRHLKRNKFTPSFSRSKRPKYSNEESKPKDLPNKNLMLLTGGQNAQKVDVRGQISSEEVFVQTDSSKETLQDSGKETHHHPTAGYISVERFITKKKKKTLNVSKEEATTDAVTVSIANLSGEGLSIEFETERKVAGKVERKFINDDTLKLENPEARLDLKNMIKNIEKQIEDVREQVDYVKNLTVETDVKQKNPKFKYHSEEIHVTKLTKPKSKSYSNSDSLERDNEEFISRYSLEKNDDIENNKTYGLELRAHDEHTTQFFNVTKINDSNVTEPAEFSITAKATTETIRVKNSKENKTTANILPIYNRARNINITKDEFNTNHTQDIQSNYNNKNATVNIKINEIDPKTMNVENKNKKQDLGFDPLVVNFTKNFQFSDENLNLY